MKKITQLALLFIGSSVFSASAQQKINYCDENLKPITKEYYAKMSKNVDFLSIQHQVDSTVYTILVQRDQSGTIPLDSLKLLRKDLEMSTQTSINEQQTLVIEYYPGSDRCNSSGAGNYLMRKSDNDFKKKKKNTLFFLIYKHDVQLPGSADDQWKPDLNARIERYFFPFHYPCGSVVAIFPDGSYTAYKGEYSLEYFYKHLKVK